MSSVTETVANGIRELAIPTRVQIRFRSDINTAMRATILGRNRVMQILSIAEIGHGVGLDMICENYSTTGQ